MFCKETMPIIFDLKSINHIYQGTINTPALSDINLKINQGEIICLAGPSGSGKSTLLNCIAGQLKPSSGQILFNNSDLLDYDDDSLANYRNQKVGMMFQDFGLIDYLNVKENIMVPMNFTDKNRNEKEKKVEELLNLINLQGTEKKLPEQLSGGQKQRIGLAVALANDPNVLVADEPTGNLDNSTAHEIMDFIISNAKKVNKTFIYSSHDKEMIDKADRVLNLKSGKIEI